jgi:glutamate racemase
MIGVFDSGVGGLSVLRELRRELPSADIVYFGDTKNAPYGTRHRDEISALTIAAIERLCAAGADNIVSACNSVSASLAISLFDAFSLSQTQLVEMVGPTVAEFRGRDARVALAATPATIKSGMYQTAFRMIGKDVATIPIAELAGAVERGAEAGGVRQIIEDALGAAATPFDVLILGCTHYPLVGSAFVEALGGRAETFDPAAAVARRARKLFWPREVGGGTLRLCISQESPVFRRFVTELFPESAKAVEVVE